MRSTAAAGPTCRRTTRRGSCTPTATATCRVVARVSSPLLMWHRCALGDVDPWHGLSILAPLSPELPALLVSGASHHAWTHPSLPTDQPSVVAARKAVRRQL